MKTVVMAKTKLNEDAANAVITALTFDWTGCTMEMLIGPATDSLKITRQAAWRRKGTIPQKEEVNVKDMIAQMGSRSQTPLTADGIAAVAGSMSKEEVNALIARLAEDAKKREADEKAAAKAEAEAERAAKKAPKGKGKDGDGKGDQPSAP